MDSRLRSFLLLLIGIAAASSAAFLLAWRSTHHGIGLTPDSVMYIGGARGLMAHRGFGMVGDDGWFKPLVTYMPGFPALLALVGNRGIDLLVAARIVECSLFAINVALVAILVWLNANRSTAMALLAAAIFAAAPVALRIHTCAWSEPAFLACLLAALGALASAMRRARLWLIAAGGVLLGCAYLDRYAAYAFIGSSVLAILLYAPQHWKRRIVIATLFGAMCSLFVIPWMIRSHRLHAGAVGRPISWHPIDTDRLCVGLRTVGDWLVPASLPRRALAWSAYVVAIAIGVLIWRRQRNAQATAEDLARPQPLLRLIWTAAIVYPLFLIVSISFFDADIPLDARILSPLFTMFLVGGFVSIANSPRRAWRYAMLPLCAVLLGLYCGGDWIEAKALRANSVGYASAAWRNSKTIAAIAQLPPDLLVYSNGRDVVYLYTHRHARLLPLERAKYPKESSAAYKRRIQDIAADLKARRAVIVHFKHARPTLDEMALRQLLNLRPMLRFDDGEIDVARARPHGSPNREAISAIPYAGGSDHESGLLR